HQALQLLRTALMRQRLRWVIDVDIEKYFDSIPHSQLRDLLDQRVTDGVIRRMAPAPPIVGGSRDPLLEWALRESASGLASLPEGSEAGLRRLARGEVTAAAIHLHRLDGDDEIANCDAVASAAGLHDAVVIAVARREQGLVVATG